MPDRVKQPCHVLVAASVAIMFTAAGCPWLDALNHHDPTTPAPTQDGGTAGHSSSQRAIIPPAPSDCPMFVNGDVPIHGVSVHLWVSDTAATGGGPLIVYWHGTGSTVVSEAVQFLGQPTIDDVLAQGGIVASLGGSTGEGTDTSTGVWTTGDYAIVDDLVSCAVAQGKVDPQRIFTAGCDSGGIEAGALAFGRSNYIAAVSMNSGGLVLKQASDGTLQPPITLQDTHRIPATLTTHGPQGFDVVIIDFSDASIRYDDAVVNYGGFAVDCPHDRGHCAASQDFIRSQWRFFQDHPYSVDPEPYASSLPSGFAPECQIVDN